MSAQRCSSFRYATIKVVISGLALSACLSGCGSGDSSNSSQSQITRYVNAQHLPQMQKPRVIELSDGQSAELFTVAYGPGDDCPSGCIYSYVAGVRNGSKIGFLKYNAAYGTGSSGLGGTGSSGISSPQYGRDSYRFDASDTLLYTDRAMDEIKKSDTFSFSYYQYLNTLASIPDVPAEVLVRVARRAFSVQTGELLLSNPTATASRDVLTVLANLADPNPAVAYFGDIRSRAQQLLNGLGH